MEDPGTTPPDSTPDASPRFDTMLPEVTEMDASPDVDQRLVTDVFVPAGATEPEDMSIPDMIVDVACILSGDDTYNGVIDEELPTAQGATHKWLLVLLILMPLRRRRVEDLQGDHSVIDSVFSEALTRDDGQKRLALKCVTIASIKSFTDMFHLLFETCSS